MKPIKQKNQEYVGLNTRLEAVIDGVIYNPRNRRHFYKSYMKGNYLRAFHRLAPFARKQYGTIRDLNLFFCGVSHLDAAWLWPVVDTKERAYKTFYKAVEHCKKFPFFKFAQAGPQYYNWIKNYDANLWNEVKEMVKLGKIEITGGMWIEPDLDMPSGESLVRQRLYGQLFYLREFGFFPKFESLLDVFGFPWSLPQILVKSGAETFWTTKIFANDHTSWPFSNFTWRGIDGTEIFTYAFTYNWDGMGNNGRFRRTNRYPAPEFNKTIIDSHVMRKDIEMKFTKNPKDFNNNMPVFYGLGDGGRGPLELEIMFADSLVQMHEGKHITQQEFFSMQKRIVGDRQFIWNDELYLEFHRGTKTTQVEVKHFNRRAECWAIAAENLLTIMNLLYPDISNLDKSRLFEMWRKILFNQFHDILPGSSIPDVYQLAIQEQRKAIQQAQTFIRECFNIITQEPDDILIFNPFNWVRSEYLSIGNQLYYNSNVPGLSIQSKKLSEIKQDPARWELITENSMEFILENDYIKVKIRKDSGTLVSLYSKTMQREFAKTENTYKGLGSGFRVFREQPQNWPAWNIDHYYFQKKVTVQVKSPARITTREDGVKQVTCDFQFLNSTGTISFYLRPKDQMLQLSIHTDLKDGKILVKYFIPVNLKSEEVRCEIPYASVVRKRIPHTEFEKGKWEINTHKWIDISDVDCGLTILNNNRYGFNATGKGVYITLTRTPVYPGVSPLYGSTRTLPKKQRPKYTDLLQFDYEFALFPHKGSWVDFNHNSDESIWQLGYDFNLPLISSLELNNFLSENQKENMQIELRNNINQGNPVKESFIECSAKNIKIGSIKVPEWSGDKLDQLAEPLNWIWNKESFIVRLVELNGEPTHSIIIFHPKLHIEKIKEVNLLEMKINEKNDNIAVLESCGRQSVELEFHKFEIKTLEIHIR